MQAGLVADVEIFEMFAEISSASVTVGGGEPGSGAISRCTSQYTPDSEEVNGGVIVAVYATRAGDGPINQTETVYRLFIEDLGIDETYTVASFNANATTRVELINLKLYAFDNYWDLRFDRIDWYTESTLRFTDDNGGSGFQLVSAAGMLTPASIPLLGILPQLNPAPLIDEAPTL